MVTTKYPTADTTASLPLDDVPENEYGRDNLRVLSSEEHKRLYEPLAVGTEIEALEQLDKPTMAQHCLDRARQYLTKNDPMQASEKLYKAAEESIKYLAELHNLTEFKQAQKHRRWSTGLLNSAPPTLSEKLDKEEIAGGWYAASHLHNEGFHENRLGVAQVKHALPYVEKLVRYVREVSDARRKDNP